MPVLHKPTKKKLRCLRQTTQSSI